MKTKILKHRVPQRILIGMLLVLFCFTSKAQTWENVHFNVDWQMNVPLNSNFADKFSGWGMNFEGKYDLTPYWAIGAFLNFHTNLKSATTRLYDTEAKIICIVSKKGAQCIECHHKDI